MSSSPSPSVSGDNKQIDQIHFRFCRECSNLLYPKEDRVNNRLMFTCRTCHVGEPATSYCVYQNKLNSQVGDTAGVTQDVGSDPTDSMNI
ncbi:DNA-directed RNA polymerase II core subunit rpb9 [Aspergillus fumigatus]